MNKTAIKSYAIWARVQLIESVKQRAFEYEVTANGENKVGLETVGGRLLSETEVEQRDQLITEIKQKGYAQVMEEAAYTWFNRFIALRFMEVNGFLPSKVRVFTDENGEFKPEILKQAMSVEIDGIDRNKVLELLDKQNNEELYKYLIITQCNALSAGLPYMFEKISDWTELLFPTNLLHQDSVIGSLIADIAVEDWNDEVEIIGWLYQYYIYEKHEEVVDPLHGKVISKEDIPAATQLFTTDWVVRYLLDNSLGRYWIERHPESRLAEKLTYFVTPKDGIIPIVNEMIRPEELKILDPCVGSGHFLSYAFDILLEIYRECGWSDRDAVKSILENNLYGIDIDERATQLACFAVMMKARKYNRRIISADTGLHIIAMQESTLISDEMIKYVSQKDASIKRDLSELRHLFDNAKEYGSIITVPQMNFSSLYARINEIETTYIDNLMDVALQKATTELLLPLVRQAEILSGKYDVVATNPPYMNKYSARLKTFIGEHFAAFKGDLFSVFMYRNFDFCKPNGYSGFMTPMVWMFIKSYQALRQFIVGHKAISTLIQFEYSAFEEATVPICSFVLKNGCEMMKGIYFNLSDYRGGMEVQRLKIEEAISSSNCTYCYETSGNKFFNIPGVPIAYWVSNQVYDSFVSQPNLGDLCEIVSGMTTGNNDEYLKLWYEIDFPDFAINCFSCDEETIKKHKWYPYNKGGEYRRWYGNNEYVVNWARHNEFNRAKTTMTHLYLQRCITWGDITSAFFNARACDGGFFFDVKGSCGFPSSDKYYGLLALLNSKITYEYIKIINPTITTQVGDLKRIPYYEDVFNGEIADLCEKNVFLCRIDWDSFETSWDFKKHPLI